MKKIIGVLFFFLFGQILLAQDYKKIDSTLKLGTVGYRIKTNNKGVDKNKLNVTPIGFEKEAREVDIEIKGRVVKAEIDDLNNDGFPDMVIYVVNTNDKSKATVLGISSNANQNMAAIQFPDIIDDAKLKIGYLGYDQYELLQGTLLRRFPLYDSTDAATPKLTGMYRQIQYKTVMGDRGMLKFKVLRTVDYVKK
jgi:hypothetical protein